MDREEILAAFKALCLLVDNCDTCTRDRACNWHSLFIASETEKALGEYR